MDHDAVRRDVEIFDVKRDVGGIVEGAEGKQKLSVEGESLVAIRLLQVRTQRDVVEDR